MYDQPSFPKDESEHPDVAFQEYSTPISALYKHEICEIPYVESPPGVNTIHAVYDESCAFAHHQHFGEKLTPIQGFGSQKLWFLVLPLIALGLTLGLFSGAWGLFGLASFSVHQSQFPVDDDPTLIIHSHAGNIHIHGVGEYFGEEPMAVVETTEHISGLGSRLFMPITHVSELNDTVTVDSQPSSNLSSFLTTNSVDLTIFVPAMTTLDVYQDNGNVSVDDVFGDIHVAEQSGTIFARNVGDVNTQSHLSVQRGSITARHLDGQVDATTQQGSISLSDADLYGQSIIQSDEGDIRFSGYIDPIGTYLFQTYNGSVTMRLPDYSSFFLHTNTSPNSVYNQFADTDFGFGLQANVTANSNNGSIHIIDMDN